MNNDGALRDGQALPSDQAQASELQFVIYAADAEYHQDAAPLELIASKYEPTE